MSMESGDAGHMSNPLLDQLQLATLHNLADWEIAELILWLENEQHRRELERWEYAETENPCPCFHVCNNSRRFLYPEISLHF